MQRGMGSAECGMRICLILIILIACLSSLVAASEKWQGTDVAVVEKFAQEQGREPKAPLIGAGQGDLLLFLFLLAGAAGGFAAGYYWRALMDRKDKHDPKGGHALR